MCEREIQILCISRGKSVCVRFECLAAGINEDTIGLEENNLRRRVLTETTSHHPEFLDKRRTLQKRTLSSSTDCNSKHSSITNSGKKPFPYHH